jgi:hypothetical protein
MRTQVYCGRGGQRCERDVYVLIGETAQGRCYTAFWPMGWVPPHCPSLRGVSRARRVPHARRRPGTGPVHRPGDRAGAWRGDRGGGGGRRDGVPAGVAALAGRLTE